MISFNSVNSYRRNIRKSLLIDNQFYGMSSMKKILQKLTLEGFSSNTSYVTSSSLKFKQKTHFFTIPFSEHHISIFLSTFFSRADTICFNLNLLQIFQVLLNRFCYYNTAYIAISNNNYIAYIFFPFTFSQSMAYSNYSPTFLPSFVNIEIFTFKAMRNGASNGQ